MSSQEPETEAAEKTGGPQIDRYSHPLIGSSSSASSWAITTRVVVRDNFLPRHIRGEVERSILAREREFVSSRVTMSAPTTTSEEMAGNDIELRRSRVIAAPGPAFRSIFVPHLRKEILAACAHASAEADDLNQSTFDQGALDISKIEIQLTASGDGDFYGLHVDGGTDRYSDRDISFVYFVCTDPGCFTGGELRLVGAEPAATDQLVEPIDNRLVIFPSRRHHEIRPVRAPSLESATADSR
jgi:hypothetical protein